MRMGSREATLNYTALKAERKREKEKESPLLRQLIARTDLTYGR